MSRPILDEFPTDLVPISETRQCDKCKAFTWWAGPKQRTKGRCISCAQFLEASAHLEAMVIANLAKAFPGTTIVVESVAKRYPAGVYDGLDAGPCRRCGGRIRLYGDKGYPLCRDCDQGKSRQ